MRKLIVTEFVSLDGVVQSPMYADEDASNGFRHGGWHPRYFDEASMNWTVEGVTRAGGYVFGRRTWEQFAAYWPKAGPEEQLLAKPLGERPKYVASRTLKAPLGWQNSSLLTGDVADAVTHLKREPGRDLLVIGSPELVHTLLARDVVDELRLMIDPLVIGGGKRLFRDDGAIRRFRLTESHVTTTGAMLVTYAREG